MRQALAAPPGEQTDAQKKLFSKYEKQLRPDDAKLAAALPEFKREVDASNKTKQQLTAERREIPRAHGLTDRRRQAGLHLHANVIGEQ